MSRDVFRFLGLVLTGKVRLAGFTLVELLLALLILGILISIATSMYGQYMERAQIAQAKSDIINIESAIERFYTASSRYPDSLDEAMGSAPLDPWGNPYQYLNMASTKGLGKVRKDKNQNPLNSDYDLYSMGKDGRSVSPLTAKASHDDIIRANNGRYVGLASDY